MSNAKRDFTALLKKQPHSTAGVLPENIFSGCNVAGSCHTFQDIFGITSWSVKERR